MEKVENWQLSEEPAPEPDEGWWAAILSDEEASNDRTEENDRAGIQPIMDEVDWDFAQTIYEQDGLLTLLVYGFNRGGLLAKGNGIQGFIPLSHLVAIFPDHASESRRTFLAAYVGQAITVKCIECVPEKDRIVLSERAAQAGEGSRKALFQVLQTGAITTGQVTNITDFGAFIDLGGVEGLVHVSELSWGRVEDPADILSLGQQVEVMVLQVNEKNSRIALSIKRLTPNPWDVVADCYQPGDVVPAVITTIQRFGAFARLQEGIEGLIHISSLTGGLSPYDLQTGMDVQVRILHIDSERRRLGLGLVAGE